MPVAKQIAAEQWVVMINKKDTDKKLPLSRRFERFLCRFKQKVVTKEIISFCSFLLNLRLFLSTWCINVLMYRLYQSTVLHFQDFYFCFEREACIVLFIYLFILIL